MSTWVRPRQAPDPEIDVFYFGEREAENESGKVLQGKFELIEPIAWGGMAAVYKARNLETRGLCAVKVLYPRAREHVASLFGQEGRLAARIRSPHLVRANAFGEDEGRPFIVFDYVQGEVLAGMYFGRLMPWRDLLRIVLQVLDALAVLHRRGIVHRDVKPDNVIVEAKLAGEVHVTLLDLGCASVPPERKLTGAPVPSREVYGTAGFIAPELLAGCPPEPRNDIYSVGALMYTKLTAQDVPDISAHPELMAIPPPRAFVPSLPERVDDIVMRALSDVEARFQSAEQMAEAIREAIAAEDRASLRELIAAEASTSASGVREEFAAKTTDRWPSSASSRPSTVVVSEPAPPIAGTRGKASAQRAVTAALLAGVFIGGGVVYAIETPGKGSSADLSARLERSEQLAEPTTPEMGVAQASPSTTSPAGGEAAKLDPAVLTSLAPSEPSNAATPIKPSARKPTIAAKTRPATSFEQVMGQLDAKARQCARAAALAEEPLEVQVLGENHAISSVRVVGLGDRHPFTRCIEPAIRAAAPPVGGEPIRRYTFFARKG